MPHVFLTEVTPDFLQKRVLGAPILEVEAKESVLKPGFHEPCDQLDGRDHQKGNIHENIIREKIYTLFTSMRSSFGLCEHAI